MKIAVLTSSYPRFPGDSAAPFVRSISEAFASFGHDVAVVAPFDPAVIGSLKGRAKVFRFRYIWPAKLHIMGHARAMQADVRLNPLAYLLLPFYLVGGLVALFRVTGQHRSDVIHVHWVIPNGPVAAVVALLRRIPFFVSLHGSDMYLAQRSRLFGWVARLVFRRASGVTACSRDLKQAAEHLGAEKKVQLLAWGADPTRFTPALRGRSSPEDFGLDHGSPAVLAIGRLVPKKGFSVLLAAFARVAAKRPDARLWIAGDGPLREALAVQSKDLGISEKVSFAGNIAWDRVPELMACADIFVLPSIRDAFGNVDGLPTVLLEAMSSGLPTVASSIGGIDLVIDDTVNGLLVPPGEPQALADALSRLLQEPTERARLGSAARQSVESEFTWTAVANRLLELFRRETRNRISVHRLGTVYREELLKNLEIHLEGSLALDIGCHDGYWLSTLDIPGKIGVDLHPIPGAPGVSFVKADGTRLPFRQGTFDAVSALDVIEHVAEDGILAEEICRVLKPGGTILLSTPSAGIRMFPAVLTEWISRKWGHDLRIGYAKDTLSGLFNQELEVRILPSNAPNYRRWYLPVRFIASFAPIRAARIARWLARKDAANPGGEQGFLLLLGRKLPSPTTGDRG